LRENKMKGGCLLFWLRTSRWRRRYVLFCVLQRGSFIFLPRFVYKANFIPSKMYFFRFDVNYMLFL